MRCKIDENMPLAAAELLRGAGHECETVYDEALGGAPDARVVDRCKTEGRVLLTLDLDFADIRRYPPATYPGIVVFRPAEPDRERVLRQVARTLAVFCADIGSVARGRFGWAGIIAREAGHACRSGSAVEDLTCKELQLAEVLIQCIGTGQRLHV